VTELLLGYNAVERLEALRRDATWMSATCVNPCSICQYSESELDRSSKILYSLLGGLTDDWNEDFFCHVLACQEP
jgi:hypothetical protein